MNDARELALIFRRLYRAYGPQHWWPAETPLEVIVGAVLTQNTAWKNVERAIANLKHHRLLSLERLARTPPVKLATIIRPAGFYNIKAQRLHSVVRWLRTRGGLTALGRIPTPELRGMLLRCHGIGPETADSILLYALGRPVFVVDAYTRRVLNRYGLTAGNETYDQVQALFHKALPRRARLFNEYHALLVRLAKERCRAIPTCVGCPLA
ncbi:MAG: endonuclease III domain-containing protein [candidate division WOR-3 bacterium]